MGGKGLNGREKIVNVKTEKRWRPIIRELIAAKGLYRTEIISELRSQRCAVVYITLVRLIRDVEKELAEDLGRTEVDYENNLGVALFRYNTMYEKAMAAGDLRLAHQIQKNIDILQGLKRPRPKPEPDKGSSGPAADGEASSEEDLDEKLSQMSEAELRQAAKGTGI